MSSGKGSRERRKLAVKAAKDAVYSAKGDATKISNPFSDERCSRIFDKYVKQWLGIYQRDQDFFREMELAYGYKPEPRHGKSGLVTFVPRHTSKGIAPSGRLQP